MSNLIPKFKAIIKRGTLSFILPHRFEDYLQSFKSGTPVLVTVQKEERTESDPLRKYYFAVVAKMISDYTGHSKDSIHEAMKIKFASEVDKKYMITIPQSVFSKTSTLNITKKKAFIEDVRRWASDFLNLYIPDPEQVDF